MLLITLSILVKKIIKKTTTNPHWIILNFNVHSVIMYIKSKEGKTYFLIKISPLELKNTQFKEQVL